MATVREESYALLRSLGVTTIFGNPGYTELPFLRDLPAAFRYILGLQEASVVAMADGYAQATRKPVLVNLHNAAGLGNALGNIGTAFHNKTPLIITTGQQVRSLMLSEPEFYVRDAAEFPKPYVKWSCQPARAEDIPAALARAYYSATQNPAGPVYVALPVGDWETEADTCVPRQVSRRTAPDPGPLGVVAEALNRSLRPALVLGAGVDRSGAWDSAVRLAERLRAAVFGAPTSARMSFPEDHPLYQGGLPFAQAPLAARLTGHDVVLVVGAAVFDYGPDAPGPVVEAGTQLLQITDDPDEAARAPVGAAVVGDVALALESLGALLREPERTPPPVRPAPEVPQASLPLSPAFVMHTLAHVRPGDAVLVLEAPSSASAVHAHLPVRQSGGFYNAGKGGLGFAVPAAVGVQMAHPERRVICVVGDGSSLYSIQALWTAAQHHLPVVFVVLNNASYAVLKASADFERLGQSVPGLDLPGLGLVQIAQGFGCEARRVERPGELEDAFRHAFRAAEPGRGLPILLDVAIDATVHPLLS